MKITIDTKVDSLCNAYTTLAFVYGVRVEFKIIAENCKVELTPVSAVDEPAVKKFTLDDIEVVTTDQNGTHHVCEPFTVEEYEPDDEGGSLGDLVVPIVPMPDHEPSYVIPSPPPPVAAIAQVLPLPPQPETVITVSPPPPPSQLESVPQGSPPYVDPYDSQPGDLDSDGSPWDATIHSESRAKNVDGTWRKRRVNKNVEVKAAIAGLEKITPNSVPAPPRDDSKLPNPPRMMVRTFVRINGAQELIAAPEDASDAELSLITGKPTTRETASDPHPTIVAEPVYPSVPPPPPAAPPVVKTAAPGAPAGTWPELMERVTKYFGAQKITSVDLAEICKTFNIGSVQECYAQPHLIPLVSSAIDAKAVAK